MSSVSIPDAGELRERLDVLTLESTADGHEWIKSRRTWAKAELNIRKNLWSTHGVGATGVTFTMRRQDLRLKDALSWKGQHCFITAIIPLGLLHMKVEAALVEPASCEDKYSGVKFPAIMTEEYHKHEQLEPYAVNTLRHVLVTPKCIELRPGKLVEVNGVSWPILTAHLLDPNKNEYIIERTVDL